MLGDARQRLLRVGNWQEVVQIGRVVRRPGEVLGEETRLVALVQMLQPQEMIAVERPVGADREPDAVQRQRVALADRGQVAMRRPAGAHVVLRVHLEEAEVGAALEDVAIVLRLQPHARARRDRHFSHLSSPPAELTRRARIRRPASAYRAARLAAGRARGPYTRRLETPHPCARREAPSSRTCPRARASTNSPGNRSSTCRRKSFPARRRNRSCRRARRRSISPGPARRQAFRLRKAPWRPRPDQSVRGILHVLAPRLKARPDRPATRLCESRDQVPIGSRLPMCPSTSMVLQVPLATSLNDLGS